MATATPKPPRAKRSKKRTPKRTKRPNGRPSSFDPKLAQQALLMLQAGMHIKTAAGAAGVSEATFYRWYAKGEPGGPRKFREFREAVDKAKHAAVAQKVVELHKIAMSGGQQSLQAITWFLSRRAPNLWGENATGDDDDIDSGGASGQSGPTVEILLHPSVSAQAGARGVVDFDILQDDDDLAAASTQSAAGADAAGDEEGPDDRPAVGPRGR